MILTLTKIYIMKTPYLLIVLALLMFASCKDSSKTKTDDVVMELNNSFDLTFSVDMLASADSQTRVTRSPFTEGEKNVLMHKQCDTCKEVNLLNLADFAVTEFFRKYADQLEADYLAAKGKGLGAKNQTINFQLSGKINENGDMIDSAVANLYGDWMMFTDTAMKMSWDTTYMGLPIIVRGPTAAEQGSFDKDAGAELAFANTVNHIEGGDCECDFPFCIRNCTTCPAPFTKDAFGNCWVNACVYSIYLECWCRNMAKFPCP
jgi:hypothetical protein